MTTKLSIEAKIRMSNLTNTGLLSKLDATIANIQDDLVRDGFEDDEIEAFIAHLAHKAIQANTAINTAMKAREEKRKAGSRMSLTEKLWYIEKFQMKMKGSLPSTAAGWIEGINKGTVQDWIEIWYEIRNDIDWVSRDQERENGNMPEWTK